MKKLLFQWLESYKSEASPEEAKKREISIESFLVKEVQNFNRGRPKNDRALIVKMVPTYAAGIPDRQLLFRGVTLFVELKRPKGGTRSPIQIEFSKQLEAAGHSVIIAKSRQDVAQIINLLNNLAK